MVKKQSQGEQERGRETRDLAYISDPNQWVTLLCPVKRYQNNVVECAYLTGDGPNLYHGNMWAPSKDDRKEEFKDFREIVIAGWKVD